VADFLTGQRLTADLLNLNVGSKRLNSTILTADSSTWSNTEASITTVTATLVSGSKYKIWFAGRISSDVAADSANIRLREDNLTGTQLLIAQVYIGTNSGNGYANYFYVEYTAVSSASKTFAFTAQRSLGTGVAHRIRAAATGPAYFAVDTLAS
jgi:hypothetical protein